MIVLHNVGLLFHGSWLLLKISLVNRNFLLNLHNFAIVFFPFTVQYLGDNSIRESSLLFFLLFSLLSLVIFVINDPPWEALRICQIIPQFFSSDWKPTIICKCNNLLYKVNLLKDNCNSPVLGMGEIRYNFIHIYLLDLSM